MKVKRIGWAGTFGRRPRPLFDVVWGALLPLLCLVLDPFVFKVSGIGTFFGGGEPWLGRWRVPAYLFFAFEMTVLVWYVARRPRGPLVNAAVAAVLFVGACAALRVAVFLLPLALIGLVVGIGVLGLIPGVTAFPYLRNAAEAVRRSRKAPLLPAGACALLAVCLVAGIPVATGEIGVRTTKEAVSTLVHGRADAVIR